MSSSKRSTLDELLAKCDKAAEVYVKASKNEAVKEHYINCLVECGTQLVEANRCAEAQPLLEKADALTAKTHFQKFDISTALLEIEEKKDLSVKPQGRP